MPTALNLLLLLVILHCWSHCQMVEVWASHVYHRWYKHHCLKNSDLDFRNRVLTDNVQVSNRKHTTFCNEEKLTINLENCAHWEI